MAELAQVQTSLTNTEHYKNLLYYHLAIPSLLGYHVPVLFKRFLYKRRPSDVTINLTVETLSSYFEYQTWNGM